MNLSAGLCLHQRPLASCRSLLPASASFLPRGPHDPEKPRSPFSNINEVMRSAPSLPQQLCSDVPSSPVGDEGSDDVIHSVTVFIQPHQSLGHKDAQDRPGAPAERDAGQGVTRACTCGITAELGAQGKQGPRGHLMEDRWGQGRRMG